jgi:hypothetical protein
MSDLASVTDLAPSEGDIPTAEDIKLLYEHVLSLWPLAASAPGVDEASYEDGQLRLSGGSRATARPLGQEHVTSVLQCCADSQSESPSNLHDACQVIGAYEQSHDDSARSAFGITLPQQFTQSAEDDMYLNFPPPRTGDSTRSGVDDMYLEAPLPHTLSLHHHSVDSEPRAPSSARYLEVKWGGLEDDRWLVYFYVTTRSPSTTSATKEMLEHPSTETEWVISIQLSDGRARP